MKMHIQNLWIMLLMFMLVFRKTLVLQGDPMRLSKVIFSDKPNFFKKCNNPMISRELMYCGFGILMFQKCKV